MCDDPAPGRNDNGSIVRTRVVGRPSIFKRKLLALNGFGLAGSGTGTMSPLRITDLRIVVSTVKAAIAEVRKVFGAVASVIGVAIGGFYVARLGLIRTMVIGAFASPISAG